MLCFFFLISSYFLSNFSTFFSLQRRMIQDLWWELSLPRLASPRLAFTRTSKTRHTLERDSVSQSVQCARHRDIFLFPILFSGHTRICTQRYKHALFHLRHPLFPRPMMRRYSPSLLLPPSSLHYLSSRTLVETFATLNLALGK